MQALGSLGFQVYDTSLHPQGITTLLLQSSHRVNLSLDTDRHAIKR